MIENVLASRYASPEMVELWDPATKVRLERELWVTVMEIQRDLGLRFPDGAIDAYRRVIDQVDLQSIAERERKLRHDVKARLEEFNSLAGYETAHLGMTSRDVTENVEQMQVKRSLDLILIRAVAALLSMARLATEYAGLAITGPPTTSPLR